MFLVEIFLRCSILVYSDAFVYQSMFHTAGWASVRVSTPACSNVSSVGTSVIVIIPVTVINVRLRSNHGSLVKWVDLHLASLDSNPAVCLFVFLVLNDTFSTNRLYRVIGV